MTFKDAYHNTTNWKRRIILISLYHNARLTRDKNWKLINTSNYFGISIGLASESIMLSKNWELIKICPSRKAALKMVKK